MKVDRATVFFCLGWKLNSTMGPHVPSYLFERMIESASISRTWSATTKWEDQQFRSGAQNPKEKFKHTLLKKPRLFIN